MVKLKVIKMEMHALSAIRELSTKLHDKEHVQFYHREEVRHYVRNNNEAYHGG